MAESIFKEDDSIRTNQDKLRIRKTSSDANRQERTNEYKNYNSENWNRMNRIEVYDKGIVG